jgi:hypothetical protein
MNHAETLREFSSENLVGFLLQELAVTGATPTIREDNGSVVRFETVLQDIKPNRNKRLYGADVLSEALGSPRIKELLATRTLYGEANHPFTSDLKRQMVVDQTRISHLITGLTPPSDGVVRGTVETAATRVGRNMRGLIVENRSTVGFSMRGMGGIRKVPNKDLVEVTRPLAVFTYDWVQFPSHPSAYMSSSQAVTEGCHPVTTSDAAEYAADQSLNARSLVEQFEMDNPEFAISEDQAALLIRSGHLIVKSFLEPSIRSEFRSALLSHV